MNLTSLQTALEPLGWRRTADALESPLGSVWLTEADACVEWISEEPKHPCLFLYHWVDDPARSLRSSWGTSIEAMPPDNGGLLQQLDDAVLRLLARRAPDTYSSSAIASDPRGEGNTEYERTLEVLR